MTSSSCRASSRSIGARAAPRRVGARRAPGAPATPTPAAAGWRSSRSTACAPTATAARRAGSTGPRSPGPARWSSGGWSPEAIPGRAEAAHDRLGAAQLARGPHPDRAGGPAGGRRVHLPIPRCHRPLGHRRARATPFRAAARRRQHAGDAARLTPLRGLPGGGLLRLSGDGLAAAGPAEEGSGVSALAGDRSRRIELVIFAALGCVAALRWVALVDHPPSGRVTFAVLLATLAGAGVAAIAGLPTSRTTRRLMAGAVAVCAVLLALVLVGLPARLLLP